MKDITLGDIEKVVERVVNRAVSRSVEKVVTSVVKRELRMSFAEQGASIDERFNEVLNAIGEEHETLLAAIGSHTVRIEDHERRVRKLEKSIA